MKREITIRGAGQKNDAEKPMWGLLLRDLWRECDDVVKVLTFGAKKYKERNWQLVEQGASRYLDAHDRHLAAVANGEWLDAETGLPHFAHAICSLFFAYWHTRKQLNKRAQDDGPLYGD